MAASWGERDLITATGWIIVGLECQNYMIECRVNIDLHGLHRGFTPSQDISQGRLQGASYKVLLMIRRRGRAEREERKTSGDMLR